MERIEEVRIVAPAAIYNKLERAVTEEDYAELVGREYKKEIQKVAATFRWTGSWHTVCLAIDRRGGLPLDEDLKNDIKEFLEPYRIAGYDVEVEEPRYVPIDIGMTVFVMESYFRSKVEETLLEEFSNRVLAAGRLGFFHPDNLTFGQTVYQSNLYALAQAVPGVISVRITKFQRRDKPSEPGPEPDKLELGRLEIARLDNSVNFPEFGILTLEMEGGR